MLDPLLAMYHLLIPDQFFVFALLPVIYLTAFFFLLPTLFFVFFLSPTSLVPFIVFRSWAYWHVTVEWACLRFCDVRNGVD